MTDRARKIVLGCPVDAVSLKESIAYCDKAIKQGEYIQQVSINAAKAIAYRKDPIIKRMVQSSDLICADGQSVVWAGRLLGEHLPERVAGIDLMLSLLSLASSRKYRVFFLGSNQTVLETVLKFVSTNYKGVVIAGARNGYFSDSEDDRVCKVIKKANAQVLFVAISSPRKEEFILKRGRATGVNLAMGVGGSFDVIAGVTKRAPRVWQHLGLEWLFRLSQEPVRLLPRYMVTNSLFIGLLLEEMIRRRLMVYRQQFTRK